MLSKLSKAQPLEELFPLTGSSSPDGQAPQKQSQINFGGLSLPIEDTSRLLLTSPWHVNGSAESGQLDTAQMLANGKCPSIVTEFLPRVQSVGSKINPERWQTRLTVTARHCTSGG
jgi:hypothetical protein